MTFLIKTPSLPQTVVGFYDCGFFQELNPLQLVKSPLITGLNKHNLWWERVTAVPRRKGEGSWKALKGPALETVKAMPVSNPDMSPAMCLEALERAFGTAESGEDLYFSFRLLQQKHNEKLSEFLRRLESSLNKVVQKGGLPANRCNGKLLF